MILDKSPRATEYRPNNDKSVSSVSPRANGSDAAPASTYTPPVSVPEPVKIEKIHSAIPPQESIDAIIAAIAARPEPTVQQLHAMIEPLCELGPTEISLLVKRLLDFVRCAVLCLTLTRAGPEQ